jgi:large subunit ribosomal protein L25
MDKTIRVKVPITLTGVAEGVRTQGGIMDQVLREVEIECLPGDIPGHIDADVTNMTFGQVLRVSDLPHAGKLKFVTNEEQTVAHVTAVKEEVVAAPEVLPTEVVAAEPEVIKKGKQEVPAEEAPAPKK